MKRDHYPVRKTSLKDARDDPFLKQTTAEERLLMMWPLTIQAWAFKGEDIRESRLQRHVVRIVKRKG